MNTKQVVKDIVTYCNSPKDYAPFKGTIKEQAFKVAKELYWFLVYVECELEGSTIIHGDNIVTSVKGLGVTISMLAKSMGIKECRAYDDDFINLAISYLRKLYITNEVEHKTNK